MDLYPLKFTPILKSKIWGGNRLHDLLQKETNGLENVGESWELSSLPGELSVVANGAFKGQTIESVIETYKDKLVGKKVYEKFGNQFPLLLKFIDANEYLSIQVHPDDAMAKAKHNSFGKTEMWYVVDAEPNAKLIVGFNQHMDKDKYIANFEAGSIKEVLNFEPVKVGDVFHLPAGRVHATGPGILFAEIQQTSDITYRIYDWDRLDDKGNGRELHTELALDAMDFTSVNEYKTFYRTDSDRVNAIVESEFFTTNYLCLTKPVQRNYATNDSFIAFMALDGQAEIKYKDENSIGMAKGETILIPAALKELVITPTTEEVKLLEIYITF